MNNLLGEDAIPFLKESSIVYDSGWKEFDPIEPCKLEPTNPARYRVIEFGTGGGCHLVERRLHGREGREYRRSTSRLGHSVGEQCPTCRTENWGRENSLPTQHSWWGSNNQEGKQLGLGRAQNLSRRMHILSVAKEYYG